MDSQKENYRRRSSSPCRKFTGTLSSTLPKDQGGTEKSNSNDLIDMWTWGEQPGKDQLEQCLQLLCEVSLSELWFSFQIILKSL